MASLHSSWVVQGKPERCCKLSVGIERHGKFQAPSRDHETGFLHPQRGLGTSDPVATINTASAEDMRNSPWRTALWACSFSRTLSTKRVSTRHSSKGNGFQARLQENQAPSSTLKVLASQRPLGDHKTHWIVLGSLSCCQEILAALSG